MNWTVHRKLNKKSSNASEDENQMQDRTSKAYFPTFLIVGVNLAVYAFTSFLSGSFLETSGEVLQIYGQWNQNVFNGGYVQLLSAMFVHVNIIHIAGNMLFLIIIGLRAEEMFSLSEYLFIYFVSGLAGNILTLLLGADLISAGASGAIFGMFGATTVYMRRAFGQSVFGALIYIFFLFVLSSFGAGINILAHLGGLAVGLGAGYVLGSIHKPRTVYRYAYTYQ